MVNNNSALETAITKTAGYVGLDWTHKLKKVFTDPGSAEHLRLYLANEGLEVRWPLALRTISFSANLLGDGVPAVNYHNTAIPLPDITITGESRIYTIWVTAMFQILERNARICLRAYKPQYSDVVGGYELEDWHRTLTTTRCHIKQQRGGSDSKPGRNNTKPAESPTWSSSLRDSAKKNKRPPMTPEVPETVMGALHLKMNLLYPESESLTRPWCLPTTLSRTRTTLP